MGKLVEENTSCVIQSDSSTKDMVLVCRVDDISLAGCKEGLLELVGATGLKMILLFLQLPRE